MFAVLRGLKFIGYGLLVCLALTMLIGVPAMRMYRSFHPLAPGTASYTSEWTCFGKSQGGYCVRRPRPAGGRPR